VVKSHTFTGKRYFFTKGVLMIAKVDIKQVLVVGVACLAINFLFGSCGKSSTINQLQSDTDRTMGAVKAEQSSVGTEIGRSQVATGNAIESISRSQTEIDRSRKAVDDFEARIRELQSLVAECQRLTTESKGIIDNIDRAN
jgi:peptidoglycan hydrolase CwlO-like protein